MPTFVSTWSLLVVLHEFSSREIISSPAPNAGNAALGRASCHRALWTDTRVPDSAALELRVYRRPLPTHHLGWTGNCVLLQERKTGHALFPDVLVNVHQLIRTLLAIATVSSCIRERFPAQKSRRWLCEPLRSPDGSQHSLRKKRIDRMAGNNRAGRKLSRTPAILANEVAHRPDLFDGGIPPEISSWSMAIISEGFVCRTISRNWPLTASGASPLWAR